MKRNRLRGLERLSELRRLAAPHGFEVRAFSDIHIRVFGNTVVDYWPTSGRAWLVGAKGRASNMTPEEVVAAALSFTDLPDGAEDHLRAIKNEGSDLFA